MIEAATFVRRLGQGFALLREGRSVEAGAVGRRLIEERPSDPGGWMLAAEAAARSGQPAQALALAERLAGRRPRDPAAQAALARYLVEAGRLGDAAARADIALALGPADAATLDALGSVLSAAGRHDTALALFRDAAARDPANPHILINLSMQYRFLGRIDDAERAADRALVTAPHDGEAQLHRSHLRRQTPESCHVAELLALLETGAQDWRGRVQLHYALAKEYEDLDDPDRAFSHMRAGANLRRRHMRYDVATDLAIMKTIGEVFDVDWLAQPGTGHAARAPIFIVGLPRTGTTLAERILTAHSDVHSAGELQDFGAQLVAMIDRRTAGAGGSRSDFVRAAAAVDCGELGRRYIEATRHAAGEAPRFVDKLPGNFLYIGLILRALPEARIVHLVRDPMDSCLAIYKTLFRQAYPYSYDLDDLGRYYIGYRRLMRHWHAVAPGRILDLAYEDLVGEQRETTRRLLAHCGLDWQSATIDFHRNAQPCTTASASQVREPIYRSSVGRWRAFARHMAPLQDRLAAAGLVEDRSS